jgi:Electron transfer DM13
MRSVKVRNLVVWSKADHRLEIRLNFLVIGCVSSDMKRFQITIGAVALILALASCSTVSTDRINDQVPATSNTVNPPVNNLPATDPLTLSSGNLAEITAGHPTSGTAKLIKLVDGTYIIRLENLQTVGGPDVRIWASEGTNLANSGTVGANAYTDLGKIKSTNGNQNYDLKLNTEQIGKVKSVIIWCQSFSVAFGGATLQ